MKFLVTVGTTSFDPLVRVVDDLMAENPHLEFVSQIGPGEYQPQNHMFFEFRPDLFEEFPNHFIITHCGAGSVYQLLELGRPFVVIPNLSRKDVHQKELASHLESEGLAMVLWKPEDLRCFVLDSLWLDFKPTPYVKDDFSMTSEILNLINRHSEQPRN
jgi:beta-1,4-N-acetylglucosaminyltransferase